MAKILLVEDNEMNSDMLKRRLERKEFDVTVATDGIVALKLIHSASPDLILMDLHLPEMDGLEVTRRIKSQTEFESIPIIALTAHAMVGDREKALEAGCDEYETKPVEFKRLLAKIRDLLEGEDMQ